MLLMNLTEPPIKEFYNFNRFITPGEHLTAALMQGCSLQWRNYIAFHDFSRPSLEFAQQQLVMLFREEWDQVKSVPGSDVDKL